jgi:CRP-like cAMP-binding protein
MSVPLTQDEIAQLAGTTRPTANRLLLEAQERGAIELARGKITVIDAEWLARRGR